MDEQFLQTCITSRLLSFSLALTAHNVHSSNTRYL